jgi:hypothetical protein
MSRIDEIFIFSEGVIEVRVLYYHIFQNMKCLNSHKYTIFLCNSLWALGCNLGLIMPHEFIKVLFDCVPAEFRDSKKHGNK